jgi:hypothetical protein
MTNPGCHQYETVNSVSRSSANSREALRRGPERASTRQTPYNARQMSKSLQIYWKDKSGTRHRFWIYPRGTKFNEPCPGIYIYARETSPHKWSPIYIGQTKNVNVRLTNHEQQECLDQNGVTHIHVSIITDDNSRLTIQKDLIEHWKPVCNRQFGLIAEEVAEVNCDRMRDDKSEIYNVPCDVLNAIWLNEFLKEHRKVQEQNVTIAQLKKNFQATIARRQKQIEVLTAGLQKVSAQLEPTKSGRQTLLNNE